MTDLQILYAHHPDELTPELLDELIKTLRAQQRNFNESGAPAKAKAAAKPKVEALGLDIDL